ncbi:metal-dependent hydrolase [Denitratisoma sp. agr-D3]
MNRPTHQLVAATAVSLYLANQERTTGPTSKPLLGGAAAALLTNLPDLLEPATSPNHRSFFHSVVFAAGLVEGFRQLNNWQPATDLEKFLRGAGMLAISAYLIHLALDFTTKKSLPILS